MRCLVLGVVLDRVSQRVERGFIVGLQEAMAAGCPGHAKGF